MQMATRQTGKQTDECNVTAQVCQEAQNFPFSIFHFPFTKPAFTLAEVLITLGIIGVVAAMTIPTLMNNINNMQYKVAYKKAFSVASQALLACSADYTCVERTGWTDATNNATIWHAFREKFNVIKYCDGSTITLSQCWDTTGEQFNTSTAPIESSPAFVDKSGMAWVKGSSQGTTMTGDTFVDTNGFNKPNKFGQDRFRLRFTVDANDLNVPGVPTQVIPDIDYTEYSAAYCKYPPCYYQSWLSQ